MAYTVRKAEQTDLPRILEIYASARHFMALTGNPNQWGTTHPPRQQLEQDIRQGDLLVVEDDQGIHGVFFFSLGEDPTYEKIEGGGWKLNTPYGTIHRMAGNGQETGVFAECLAWCREQIGHIRIDTHEDNRIMQHLIEKHGFVRCGIIHVADGSPRIAYEWMEDI